ncbi:MAG: serine/threonine-protein kinase [Akkermansia sp.]
MTDPTSLPQHETSTHEVIVQETLSAHVDHTPALTPEEEREKDPFFVYQRELATGTKLDHYEIERVLGGGGFGITYLAKDILLNRQVVIKENFPSACSHRDPLNGRIIPNNAHDLESYNWALRSFLNEARTIAELDHLGIVKILSIFESNGTAYFAMEFVDGLSLEYLGEHLISTGKRYTEDELKGLLYRLLSILNYLHGQQIYHRDIKPGNILLTQEGTPVLIDFGAARHADRINTQTIMTTLGYSSPEQTLGSHDIGPWSDLYSLGATFYAILTGQPPDRAEVRINSDTSMPLNTIWDLKLLYSDDFLKSIDKALSPHPENRYQTANEWLHDLDISVASRQSTIIVSQQIKAPHQEPIRQTPTHEQTDTAHLTKATPHKRPFLRLVLWALSMFVFILISGFILFALDIAKKSDIKKLTNIPDIVNIKNVIKQNIPTFTPQLTDTSSNVSPQFSTLTSIPIPDIGIPLDSPSIPELVQTFSLRLTDSAITANNLPTPLPQNLKFSAIYFLASTVDTNDKGNNQNIYLIIKDSSGASIARSANAIQLGKIAGQASICYSFPTLPTLNINKTYIFHFENDNGEPQAIHLSTLLNLTNDTDKKYPVIRIICTPPEAPVVIPQTPSEKILMAQLSGQKNNNETRSASVSTDLLPFLRALATEGYPEAQFNLSRREATSNATDSIIWLYKSAIGAYPPAQRELGALLMGASSFYPSLPKMPSIAEKDYAQAARFLRMALHHKDAYSLYLLGIMHSQGWGVPKRSDEARLFYNHATKLDASIITQHISTNNMILAYWGQNELKPHTALSLKVPLPSTLSSPMLGIKLICTGGLSECTISNIRLTKNKTSIATIPTPQIIIPGNPPISLKIAPPSGILSSSTDPIYLEMNILTQGTNNGIVELETQKKVDSPQ